MNFPSVEATLGNGSSQLTNSLQWRKNTGAEAMALTELPRKAGQLKGSGTGAEWTMTGWW